MAVADVAGDGQRLGVQVDGLPVLAQAIVADPEVAQHGALAGRSPMSRDGQRLGVQVDGLPVLAQAVVADPQVAQRGALALAVADVAGDGQRLGVQVDGLPVLAQAVVAAPQVAQRDALARRSPMSRAMASAWVCRSMACRYSPRRRWQIPRLIRWASFRAGSVIRPWMRPCSSTRMR